jgi:hypothetical protein
MPLAHTEPVLFKVRPGASASEGEIATRMNGLMDQLRFFYNSGVEVTVKPSAKGFEVTCREAKAAKPVKRTKSKLP